RNPIRVALSIIAIDNSSGKPRPLGVAPAAAFGESSVFSDAVSRAGRPRIARIATAAHSPTMPITVTAARHGISVNSQAVAAGNAILPRSPEKLYPASAWRDRAPENACDTRCAPI